MFDVIGKRRWFYALSALLTIPGLIFILISPFSDAGLQLTIDYTGGTRWEIKFQDPAVTPAQVEAVFAANDLDATAIRTGSGLHRDQDRADRPAARAGSDGRAVSVAGGVGFRWSERVAERIGVGIGRSLGIGVGRSVCVTRRLPIRLAARRAPIGNTELPTDGKLGEMVVALESRSARSNRRPASPRSARSSAPTCCARPSSSSSSARSGSSAGSRTASAT